jgi:hypothetical protein
MSDLPLGQLIDAHQQRDAIHVAVAPVVAHETLYPGQHIGFVDGSTERVAPVADGRTIKALGIVDPFLQQRVLRDERCWMFLYPRTITSLRHDWTHPAFAGAAPPPKGAAERWLRALADEMGMSFANLMAAAALWVAEGDYTVEHGSSSWRDQFGDRAEEFWRHYETFSGVAVKNREWFFSCSC